mmetsp:Transcript_16773/g.25343  ORF Transcript_16773/g.25343 Transcript_16773/m.25343 type:complete len:279 (-) Transcript_16773:188-1024(-)|eukprot:CAMPEP_0178895218 /NCGR_PEP_ID=MMETSP0786-20121207/462_1 /TAXON_ID=186022 /ORGANISM="Thalassionema frauenfeldii, Strain CCMP 1798" /LENGTH=278 /DNA_ID=CAMNT_0020565419 /DNA_START=75 /DNA_END=911 /DNA_ORIENTATION=+
MRAELTVILVFLAFLPSSSAFFSTKQKLVAKRPQLARTPLLHFPSSDKNNVDSGTSSDDSRSIPCSERSSDRRSFLYTAVGAPLTVPVSAMASSENIPEKSHTNGYAIQHTEQEWHEMLSPQQYSILRKGGTERQRSSILNEEYRSGTYACAGCGTALFRSEAKFKSGTGWPSFASALDLEGETGISSVEVEDVSAVQMTLGGAEVYCQTCGGHLGDVFVDGWKFTGTPAAKTGRRYCIDGAALVFRPEDGGKEVRGDRPPPNKVIEYEQPLYRTTPS